MSLSEQCTRYIHGSIRVGGKLALIDLCNRLIATYHTKFGEEAYQIIRIEKGFMTLMGAILIGEDIYIIGREVFLKTEVTVYGKRIYAKVLDDAPLKKACIKMLYAIKSIQY